MLYKNIHIVFKLHQSPFAHNDGAWKKKKKKSTFANILIDADTLLLLKCSTVSMDNIIKITPERKSCLTLMGYKKCVRAAW